MTINKVTALTAANIKTDPVTVRAEHNGSKNEFNLDIDGTFGATILVLRKLDKINASQANNIAHTGADGDAALTVAGLKGVVADELIGMYVRNDTDGTTEALKSMGLITDNTSTVITATLAGGTDNDFDAGDECSLWKVVGTYTAGQSLIGSNGNDVADILALMSVWSSGTARVVISQ